MQKGLSELRKIWKQNTLLQNISWVGNVVLFLVILPWILLKELVSGRNE